MDFSQKEQEVLEERLNIVLLKMADLQERIWDGLELLEERGRLQPELEEHIHRIMSDVSYWIDQCTTASESPPVLLRRMEVHLARLASIEELINNALG